MNSRFYIGVDVGTSSVRAVLVAADGSFLQRSNIPISIWVDFKADHCEQSSINIWDAVTLAIRNIMETSGVRADMVYGVGFDATCSLVTMDSDFCPISVGCPDNKDRNIIMWMDHRAKTQALRINSTRSDVLRSVGGQLSSEMQLPKLLWLRENMTDDWWDRASHFMGLPDFLTWRATGCLSRSLCSVVCKWLYRNNCDGISEWPRDFFEQIGLFDLTCDNFHKIGSEILNPGDPCGSGLTEEVATALGLNPGTRVATSIIDAYAGCLGTIACGRMQAVVSIPLSERLIMICGTSTCHLSVSEEAVYVEGIWGPCNSVIFPGLWVSEGGQSAAGSLLDHVITTHSAYEEAKQLADERGCDIYEYLHRVLEEMAEKSQLTSLSHLTQHLHTWPDYHGNRSPLADDTITGMLCGLTMSHSVDDLAKVYLSTVQALAYGTRHIMEKMGKNGRHFKVITMCGGLNKNRLYITLHSDITGLPVIVPHTADTVLLGSAMLAAKAAGHVRTLREAAEKMSGDGDIYSPNTDDQSFHERKYKVFLKMVEDQIQYRNIMNAA